MGTKIPVSLAMTIVVPVRHSVKRRKNKKCEKKVKLLLPLGNHVLASECLALLDCLPAARLLPGWLAVLVFPYFVNQRQKMLSHHDKFPYFHFIVHLNICIERTRTCGGNNKSWEVAFQATKELSHARALPLLVWIGSRSTDRRWVWLTNFFHTHPVQTCDTSPLCGRVPLAKKLLCQQ